MFQMNVATLVVVISSLFLPIFTAANASNEVIMSFPEGGSDTLGNLTVFDNNTLLTDSIKQVSNRRLKPEEIPEGLSRQEWSRIQQQVRQREYRAYEQGDGSYASSNISNGWHIDYHRNGRTTLTPYKTQKNNYYIGLQLKSLGYAMQSDYNKPQKIVSDKIRLTYHWNDNVKEIWTNSRSQLEQWFELQHRPLGAQQGEPLTLQMELTTDLHVTQEGNTLRFFDKNNISQISYSKLKVWDKAGTEIPARMQLQNNILSLVIDDRLAQYPLTVDPSFQQQAYIKASNAETDDFFGFSVDISGDTMVVGAFLEASSAKGVNGDQTNNAAISAGAAYVFTRTSGNWSQQAYLKASNTETNDRFGASVAISGNTLVVGAPDEESNASGVNGDQLNNLATGSIWSHQAYLKASNPDITDGFGSSVAISGETVVVGSDGESSNATGIGGDQTDNSANASGAAYVFIRTAGVWSQQAYLKASNAETRDFFGKAVAISGDTLVVNAFGEDSNATGIDGNQADNSASGSGAVYVFNRVAGTWSQQTYFKASSTGLRNYGGSVAIAGDTLVVGSNAEQGFAGAVYVYTRTTGAWSQQAYLEASNADPFDAFGTNVAISIDTLVIGADGENSNATGINGNQANNSAVASGAVYVFTRTAGIWSQQDYLKASNTDSRDHFGYPVAISGETVVVGAFGESSNAKGISGNEADNSADDAGAVYVFSPFSAGPVNQTITAFSATPPSGTVAGSSTLNATASSGLTVTFASITSAICSVSGSTVSYLTVGTCTVTADQAGDANFNPAPQVTLNIGVGLLNQAITNFISIPTPGIVNSTSTLSATAGASSSPVTFGSSTPAVCTVTGSTVSYATAGTCTVTANQAGDASYNAAPQVTLDISVSKADQTIVGLISSPATGVVGGTSTLSATASSGLVVTFASSTSVVCTVSGRTVSYLTVGICTITADQAGDVNYNAAPQVKINMTVNKADQTIIDFIANPRSGFLGGSSTLSATASSGLPVIFASGTTVKRARDFDVCRVSGNTVSYLAAGTCTVTADQLGDVNYNAAPQLALDINVTTVPPVIPPAKIPTLSEWSLILMSLFMLAIASVIIRRKSLN